MKIAGGTGIKAILVISMLLIFFGLFGSGIIARMNPDYSKSNRKVVAEAYQKLKEDKDNINTAIYVLLVHSRSNDFYLKVKKTSDSISFLGLVLLVLSFYLIVLKIIEVERYK